MSQPSLAPGSSSSSQPPSPIPSLIQPVSLVTPCPTYRDDLESKLNLSITDICPVCSVKVGFHLYRPTSSTTGSVITKSSNKDGSKSVLPKWKRDGTPVRQHLETVERILRIDLVDEVHWPRLLTKTVEGNDDARWIMSNIVDAGVKWNEAKAQFTSHFEVYTLNERLIRDYETIQQEAKETVQQYSDRFMSLVEQLGYRTTDQLIIQHFIEHFTSSFRSKFRKSLDESALTLGKDVVLDTVKAAIERALRVEAIAVRNSGVPSFMHSSSHNNNNSNNSNSNNSNSNSNNSKNDKDKSQRGHVSPCVYHPGTHTRHTTAECSLNPANSGKSNGSSSNSNNTSGGTYASVVKATSTNTPSIVKTGKDGKPIKCYACNGYGHTAYDKQCPRYAERTEGTRTGTTFKPASSTIATITASTSVPSSSATASGNKELKAVTINPDPASASSNQQQSVLDRTLPADVIMSPRREVMTLLNNRVYSTLIDTGASCSFIDESLVKELGLPIIAPPIGSTVALAHSGHVVDRMGSVLVNATVLYPHTDRQATPVSHEFEIFPLCSDNTGQPFYMGRDLLPNLFPEAIPRQYYTDANSVRANGTYHQLCAANIVESASTADTDASVIHVSTAAALELDYSMRRQQLLNDVSSLLQINAALTGFCNVPEATVHLVIDPAYENKLYRKQYPIPEVMKNLCHAKIMEWFHTGVIELAPPGCKYNNPITVPKKDAAGVVVGARPCLDSRGLNEALIVGDGFLLPKIIDALERLGGNCIFSEFDLADAYNQLLLHPDSRPLTAFTWEGQQYVFVGCPFGLNLLTSHFQRIITRIFSDLSFCHPYVDNLPFAAKDWETHTEQAMAIIDRCNQVNLRIKPKFDKIGHSEMRCLGHVVNAAGIAIDPSKMKAIQDWPLPATCKDLASFLGLCSFVRAHVRHYAELTGPLEEAKMHEPLVHTEETVRCFETLKQALVNSPILSYPDYDKPFHIATDASQTGVGGVLFQPADDSEHITPHNIVAIVSKKLNETQTRWPAYKKELFGVVHSLRKFHTYVWGRYDLVVHTDHKPLTYIFSSSKLSPALQQWLDVLLDYTFEIRHRDGILNVIPDTLSRMYGSAYSQSPVWGVNGQFTTAPITFVGEGEGSASNAVNNPPNTLPHTPTNTLPHSPSHTLTNTPQSSTSKDNIQCNSASINASDSSVDLKIELEKRGKTCPDTDEEKAELIAKAHQFGHFGREAVFKHLWNQGYWWPSIRSDINNLLTDCDACTRYVVVKAGYHPATPITATGPGDHMQIDTSVHLPPSPDGYTALLVCIDVYTGFVILRALKQTTAEIVANELWSIFSIIGLPKILQSDNGPEFVNDVLHTLVTITGIERRFISPYNPRADGKVERSIGTVMMIIKKMLHGTSNHWPLFVNFAQLTFNNKVSSLTGSTPFALMFGRTLNPLKDYSTTHMTPIPLTDWEQHQQKIASLIYPAITERTKNSKDALIKSLNKQRRQLLPSAFPSGSTVMITDPTRANKFEPKYIGPYIVVRRSRGGAYVLKDMTGDQLDRRVPPDQIKLLHRSARQKDTDEPTYEVESVVNHRGDPGQYEYLVQWKNYNDEHNSWEPAVNFLDDKCIQDYWKSQRSS
jgi:hypothetical protein